MAGLAMGFPLTESRGGSSPDVSLLYDINGLAKDAPHWFDRAMEFVGEWGILLAMVTVALWCWWSVRRRGTAEDSVSGFVALVWAPLAAGIALLINIPIRGFVERPRPFLDHRGIEVLVSGKTDYSFVSDHATMAMAIGAGLFIAHRKFGWAAIGLALVEGFCRVYMGVHYPTDVIGGFALGTAVTLLLAPLALALLTPVVSALASSGRAGRLVRSKRAPAQPDRPEPLGVHDPRTEGAGQNDLAA
ncbi:MULTISPECIES: phosphatase PAP2 family protein [unclassified Streptomyces]|uniref:phosphatase PAP2 family protein n=1 Tax=unclassified Streptomyces TaxID=2593676 RepID=UPI003331380C